MKVYIAGPYSVGGVEENVKRAIAEGETLMRAGHVAFVPHLYHTWDLVYKHNWHEWMVQCLHWVRACDALVRIPGESKGADIEVMVAMSHSMGVFESAIELINICGNGDLGSMEKLLNQASK